MFHSCRGGKVARTHTFGEVLTALYEMIDRPLPSGLDSANEYTTEAEAILRADGWESNPDDDRGQRCLVRTTDDRLSNFAIQVLPGTTEWSVNINFFKPWPKGWSDAHKIGFLYAHQMQVNPAHVSLFPGIPVCLMLMIAEECVCTRFIENQFSFDLVCARLLFSLIDRLGAEYIADTTGVEIHAGNKAIVLSTRLVMVNYRYFLRVREENRTCGN